MNNNQRKLLVAVGVVFIVMLAFPPFTATVKGSTISGGYSFIFMKPGERYSALYHIDVLLLFVQWLFVAAIGFVGWNLLKEK